MDEDESIREVTPEEFKGLRAQICKAREAAKANGHAELEADAEEQVDAQAQMSQEAWELGLKIWKLRKEGYTRLQILEQLEIPLRMLDDCLTQFESRIAMQTEAAIEHYRKLDDERIENLVRCWLPIANGGPVEVEKTRNGQTYTELDSDLPLKASYLVLQCVEKRMKLLEASRPEAGKDGSAPANNIYVWLQQVMPSIQNVVKAVENAPTNGARKTLTLESEAENMGLD